MNFPRHVLSVIVVFEVLVRMAEAADFNIPAGNVQALKDAIIAANSNGESDLIQLASGSPPVSYTITDVDNGVDGLPVIGADGGHSLTIRGTATIQRSTSPSTPNFRIFHIGSGANVTLLFLKILNGKAEGGAVLLDGATVTTLACTMDNNSSPTTGGAIFNSEGKLTLEAGSFTNDSATGAGGAIFNRGDVTLINHPSFISNFAHEGGAIYNDGSPGNVILTISQAVFNVNTADNGGAIYNNGSLGNVTLTMVDGSFSRNSQTGGAGAGGAIYNYAEHGNVSLAIDKSTFSRNASDGKGGAICSDARQFGTITTTIGNSTFALNSASTGGAIYNIDAGDSNSVSNVGLTSSTLSGNTAAVGSAIYNSSASGGGTTQIASSIFNAAGASAMLGGDQIISLGHNLCSDSGNGFLNNSADQINTNPMLDPNGLQFHGGRTDTIALLSTSPAINASGPNTAERDQCYRLRNGPGDIGAFEYGGFVAPLRIYSPRAHGQGIIHYDIDLLAGEVECRVPSTPYSYAVDLLFASGVTISNAQVVSGSGSVAFIEGNGFFNPRVNLLDVTSGQTLQVLLSHVNDGTSTRDITFSMKVLVGDVNGNGVVNASDVAQAKAQTGQPVTLQNFRSDVTENGEINSSDVNLVKARSGMALP